jgi:hypothetical protein
MMSRQLHARAPPAPREAAHRIVNQSPEGAGLVIHCATRGGCMKYSQEFAGRYLKAADLEGLPQPVLVTIASIEMETAKSKGGESKVHVLYTDKFEKGVIFKKQMGLVLANAFGDDMDDWIGREIGLVTRTQEFAGEEFVVIRFTIPKAKPVALPAKALAGKS